MILDSRPRLSAIIREVWRPLTGLFVWDVIVTLYHVYSPIRSPALPLTLFGSALALFLGFAVNSSYQRWWEARGLWGAMINASRSLAHATVAFAAGQDPARTDLRRAIVLRQIAYVHTLREQLRRQTVGEAARRFFADDVVSVWTGRTNPANAIVEDMVAQVAAAREAGVIDSLQQLQLGSILVTIANAQGGMERIKNTPLPNQYRFFPSFFTRLFCVLLPIGLVETLELATPVGSTVAGLMFLAVLATGDDLVDPFANTVHDVPLSGMTRTIEIDLLEALGDPAPKPLEPVKGVLW